MAETPIRAVIFDVSSVILSGRLAKPCGEIFRLVLKKLHTRPIECIFVDDTKENIWMARQLGFNVVLFRGAHDLKARLKALGTKA